MKNLTTDRAGLKPFPMASFPALTRRDACAGLVTALFAAAAPEAGETSFPSTTGTAANHEHNIGSQDITTVLVGETLPRFDNIKAGVRRYLRYAVRDGRRETVDIWQREVIFLESEGRSLIGIDQRWDRVVPPVSVRTQTSLFDVDTFRPLTHVNRVERDDEVTIAAYRFEDDMIVSDDTVVENAKRGFAQATPEPTFNFETDLELFQALPWGLGYSASLMLYDPGLAAPARYVFRTSRSESIPASDGTAIDCWVVTADYNTGAVVKTFWIAKSTQLVMHEEAERDGVVYVKTMIGLEAADFSRHSVRVDMQASGASQ